MAPTADAAYADGLAGLLADTESPGRRRILHLMGELLEEAGRREQVQDRPTDEALVDQHRLDQHRRGLRPKSITAREGHLRVFARWMAPRSLLDATKTDVEGWLDSRRELAQQVGKADLANATRSSYLSHVKCFYDWCIDKDFLVTNPTTGIQKPRKASALPRPLTTAELRLALNPAHFGRTYAHRRLRAFVLLGVFGGLRAQEMAGILVEDIDAEHGELKIRDGKGGKQRTIPLHDAVLEALWDLPLPETGAVFVMERVGSHDKARPGRRPVNGQQISPHNVSHLLSDYLRGIGIDKNGHALRHTFATMIYRSTQDIVMTKELLGHASISTTQIYAACDPARKAPAVQALRVGE